jgi:DNA polymerase-4
VGNQLLPAEVDFSREQLVAHFGKSGYFYYDIARGVDERPVQPSRQRKSVGTETTLYEDIIDRAMVESILHEQACKVVESLNKRKLEGRTVTLKLRYDNFETVTRSLTTDYPLAEAKDIISLLPRLLHATEVGRRKIRLVGISCSNLVDLHRKDKRIWRQLRLPGFTQQV